jgi:hypothetical protein
MNTTKPIQKTKQSGNQQCRKQYKRFPYAKVAKMWAKGMSIAEIARATKRVDKNNPNGDLYHSLRNFLYRMHKGYAGADGKIIRLPYRVPKKTVRAAREAGLRAW